MEKTQQVATRYSIFPDINGVHIGYEQRRKELNLLTLKQRRVIASILFLHKIHHSEMIPKYQQLIINCLHINVNNLRNPPLFGRNMESLPKSSPIYISMTYWNNHRNIIKINDSYQLIRSKLHNFFINQIHWSDLVTRLLTNYITRYMILTYIIYIKHTGKPLHIKLT